MCSSGENNKDLEKVHKRNIRLVFCNCESFVEVLFFLCVDDSESMVSQNLCAVSVHSQTFFLFARLVGRDKTKMLHVVVRRGSQNCKANAQLYIVTRAVARPASH